MRSPRPALGRSPQMPSLAASPATWQRYRAAIALSWLLLVPLGFATKIYHGPFASWVNGSAGGILYVIFWTQAIALLVPAASPRRQALGVFGITSLLELAQRWQPPWLQAIRATVPGQWLLGRQFDGWDFGHYAIGAILAAGGLMWLRRVSLRRSP